MSETFQPLDWVKATNVYEVNTRQYSSEGSFSAFATHLPRLKAMGVETLWLMPITPIAKKNKKGSLGSPYACSSYTSVSPELGTMQDLQLLIKVAHSMDFKVIIDWVANHTGWDHEWTVEHPEYYKKDSATNDFKIASGMEDIIELDYNNPALRKAMISAMEFWVKECDIDGYRCDLASWVQLDFWLEARPHIDAVKPLFWLGEFDELDYPDYKPVFDCSYSWRWMHHTEDFYKNKESLSSIDDLLVKYDMVVPNSMNLWFTSNHDENSWNGTEYEKYGNMALSLAVFGYAWNGVPLVYSGQEMPNLKRLKFFDKDIIEWTDQFALHDFYRLLNAVKKNNPSLRAGDEAVTTYRLQTGATNIIAFLRRNGNHGVLCIINWSNEAIQVNLTASIIAGRYRNVFDETLIDIGSSNAFDMAGWGFLLYEKV